jgi:hypothetical protein
MNAPIGRMSLPIHLFARGVRPTTAEDFMARVLGARLERLGTNFRRLGVRLEEVIDVGGDLEIVCKVKVTLAKAFDVPPFMVEGHATHVRDAVDLVADAIEAEVRRAIEEAGTPPARRASREAGRAAPRPTTITVRRSREGKVHAESTRKSANRSKRDSNLVRQSRRDLHSPESRARAAHG